LSNFIGDYVLLGVEEDIGPRANLGQGGAVFAFKSFLNRFLNVFCFVNLLFILLCGSKLYFLSHDTMRYIEKFLKK
jgi:hypothetical protein